ncbi:hypothetical protein GCM10022225_83560 [Plantactinospora mayteni]|uniref:Bacteriocin biosynthesis cyclodehydratase domain-containing protein n=1 Tax=Plantactinospora mayteni TaxID=566021 RepID=A0ABQ4F4K8_9ACTN|nr:TOMM precursor leader peptide-binding protein [Plantactinospora mayteni]GIH01810.1 hypothetical protein Pma05_83820 [Plantactinospora mayteni]
MAAAVRLSQVVLLASGEFGRRLTDVLQGCLPAERVRPAQTLEESFASRPDVVVAALWRADHTMCERADILAHKAGVSWLPVVLDHLTLRVGPFVSPGQGPCFRCFERRAAQHDPHWDSTPALRAGYERDQTLGPRGILPQHTRLAAGVAAGLLRQTAAGNPPAGRLVTVALPKMTVQRHHVVAEHACSRCRTTPTRGGLTALLRLGTSEKIHV